MRQASDERFRSFFEYAPFGICVCSRDGRIANVNAAFCRMLGYSEQEALLGTKWADLTHPDDLLGAGMRRDRLWAGTIDWIDGEIRWLHRTGSVVWTRLRASMIREDGIPVYSVLHVEDITERKRVEDALRESEERFRTMADGCPTLLWVTNTEGGNQFVNRAYREFGGTTYEQVEGANWQLLIHPDDAAQYVEKFDRAVREHASFRAEARIRDAKGEWRYLESHGQPRFSASGEYLGHVGLSSDITERSESEQVLRSSEEKFRQLTENIREVFWMADSKAQEVIYVSPAFEEIWGLKCESIYLNPKTWIDSIHPEDRLRANQNFLRQVQGEVLENEYRIVQPSGAVRWIRDRSFPIHDSRGKVVRVAGVAEDMTERKLSELRLIHQAYHDELTGLPNRRLFRERLAQAAAACGVGESGAVFFVDLDEFKLVNDTLGHPVGDHLIQEVASRLLRVCAGANNTLARFGGDEFTLLATGFQKMDAVREFGNELLRCIDAPFRIDSREVFIGASIGIGVFPENGTEPHGLMKAANLAMHEAKRAGKNQLKFFTPELAEAARERLELETRLRQALALSEFKLKFQPQFAPGRPRPTRFEALIFWASPDHQPIAPMKFIPIAEQNGLIVPIGTWVLREACRLCAGWQTGDLSGIGVAVNVSASQFAAPDFVDIVVRTLELTGLPPRLLELELTESVFIKDVRESARSLTKLRDLGVTIALDDFGTGYSSLSYLQELPLDALKIDRSFLTENESRPHGAAVLRCLVDLAHTLGLRVVAEGVETTAQLDFLASLGCDEVQGFLLGAPAFSVNGELNRRD